MASLVVAGDVSGSVTLSAPSAAGSTVITLPTTSGTMVVTGGAQTVQFAAGSAASPSITFTGDTNTGIFSPAADTIAFSEGGVESMRITSAGDVGIGQSSPVNIAGYTIQTINNSSTGAGVYLQSNGTTVGRILNTATDFFVGGVSVGSACILQSGGVVRMRVNAGAPILCLDGGNTSATGTGIAFPATQSASSDANTLDDYEEGTWTPTVSFNGGTTGITYSQRIGNYVKIGRQVTAWFFIQLSNKGSSTGLARIESFPFTAASVVPEYALSLYLYSGFNSVTSSTAIAYMDGTSTFEIRPSSGTTNLTDANFSNTSFFWGTLVYQTST